MGETDSEYAFCLLLDALAERARGECGTLSAPDLVARIAPLVERLAGFGEFNLMLSDGENVVAHAHTRLHLLHRTCDHEDCQQDVILLATSPLTDETWVPLIPGSLHVFVRGREVIPRARCSPSTAASEPHESTVEEMRV
jgi:glutamine amidotransferase